MRAALVTEQPLLAAGFKAAFDKAPDASLVAVYRDPAELMILLPVVAADIAIIDVAPELNFKALADVCAATPDCKFVLLTRAVTAELTYHAREIGASGLLPTTLDVDKLVSCLRRVQRGESVFDTAPQSDPAGVRTVRLTPRESQLVQLVSRGLKNKEIAACLGIGEGTVKVYLSKLFQKVGANDRLELALFGLQNLVGSSEPSSTSADPVRPPTRPVPLPGGAKTPIVRQPTLQRVALR